MNQSRFDRLNWGTKPLPPSGPRPTARDLPGCREQMDSPAANRNLFQIEQGEVTESMVKTRDRLYSVPEKSTINCLDWVPAVADADRKQYYQPNCRPRPSTAP